MMAYFIPQLLAIMLLVVSISCYGWAAYANYALHFHRRAAREALAGIGIQIVWIVILTWGRFF